MSSPSLLRSALTLSGGTALSQAIVVLASPLLTRLYTPADFGDFTVFVSLLAILACISTMRFELAIPLPQNDTNAASVLFLSCLSALIYSVILSAMVSLPYVAELAAEYAPNIAPWLWLLPVGSLAIGLYQSLYYWAIRRKTYTTIARTKIVQSVMMVAIQLASFFAGSAGLIFGHVISRFFGFGSLVSVKHNAQTFQRAASPRLLWRQAVRYNNFPFWSAPGTFLNAVGAHAPFLAFAFLYSSQVAGLYGLAQRVLAAPISLVGVALADVFLSDAADAYRRGRLGAVTGHLLDALVIAGLPATAALMLTGRNLFALAFGSQWADAGLIAAYAAPWFFLTLLASPLSRVFSVAERQRELFFIQVTQPVVGLSAVFLGATLQWQFIQTFALFACAYSVFYALYLLRSLFIARVNILDKGKSALRIGAVVLVILVLPFLLAANHIRDFQHRAHFELGLVIILLCFCYAALLAKHRKHSYRFRN